MRRLERSRIADPGDIAGVDIKSGQVVWQDYIRGHKLMPVKASDAFTVRGLALNDAGPDEQVAVVIAGEVEFPAPRFQTGMLYVAHHETPGELLPITALPEGYVVHYIGMAKSETVLDINLQSHLITLGSASIAFNVELVPDEDEDTKELPPAPLESPLKKHGRKTE